MTAIVHCAGCMWRHLAIQSTLLNHRQKERTIISGSDVEIHHATVDGKCLFRNNCNKFYCNLTFYKLNTYLILTSAWFGFVEQNVSTDKNFLRNIFVTRGDPFVCACPRLRSSRCRQTNVESSSLYFWSPENKLCGEVGWVYPCEDKVSI